MITKTWQWCKRRWQWLILIAGSLVAFMLGSKRQRGLKIDAELERDQYKKESEFAEKARRKERKKLVVAEIKYQQALQDLEKKYDDDKSALNREKDAAYKKMIEEVKHDPDKLDSILKDMGINES
tara:strand:+ start:3553 stop:3927 length:375 start_codon:yes stop_codon:yes gene_type:complete